MKKALLAAVAAVVAIAGAGAAIAIAGSGSNVACVTSPAHTVAVDGSPVSTTPTDVACVTASAVTVTVTQPATTTVDYYFDGTLEASATAGSVGLSNLLSYRQVANVSLNMGGWAGTPTGSGPYSVVVDYVRVSALG